MVNIGLESSRGVSKTHGHYYKFVVSVLGPESRLLFVSYLNSKAVISVLKVDFTKVLSPSNLVYNLSN